MNTHVNSNAIFKFNFLQDPMNSDSLYFNGEEANMLSNKLINSAENFIRIYLVIFNKNMAST